MIYPWPLLFKMQSWKVWNKMTRKDMSDGFFSSHPVAEYDGKYGLFID